MEAVEAEVRNMSGSALPLKTSRQWTTFGRCHVCGTRLSSNGKITWCECCYEKKVDEIIAQGSDFHETTMLHAFYYLSMKEIMDIFHMHYFLFRWKLKELCRKKGYKLPTREDIFMSSVKERLDK